MGKVTVAVVQAGSNVFDTQRTLERLARFCEQAADKHARLVVFPEAFLGGYPKGIDFGARVGSRSSEGRDDFRSYWNAAIEVPGPEISKLGEIAKRLRLNLVTGLIERVGGTLYCSVVFIGPDGSLQGIHRKLMPTAMERLVWGFGDGSTMPVVKTNFGILGAGICWENYMPLFRMAMYAKGVNIWCAPTVDDREVWQSTMRHIAVEGRCFVLCACQFLLRSQCPENYHPIQGSAPETILIKGGSVIVSPLGEVLAGPLRDAEGVLTAELDMDDVARGKYDLDVVGHYARPDVFRLVVDETAKNPVNYTRADDSTESLPNASEDRAGVARKVAVRD